MTKVPSEIQYVLSYDERFDAVDFIFDAEVFRPAMRRLKRRACFLGIAITTIVSLLAFGFLHWKGWRPNPAGYIFFYAPGIFFGIWWGYKHMLTPLIFNRVFSVAYSICRGSAGPGFDTEITLRISEAGLHGSENWRYWTLCWPFIRSIKRTPTITGFELLDTRWLIIPRSAFQSDDAYLGFVDEIEDRDRRAGGIAKVVADHLRHHSLVCGGCGYQLLGTLDAKCPECGRGVILTDFRSHTTERVSSDEQP